MQLLCTLLEQSAHRHPKPVCHLQSHHSTKYFTVFPPPPSYLPCSSPQFNLSTGGMSWSANRLHSNFCWWKPQGKFSIDPTPGNAQYGESGKYCVVLGTKILLDLSASHYLLRTSVPPEISLHQPLTFLCSSLRRVSFCRGSLISQRTILSITVL